MIDLVCKISKPDKMFEMNANNIYLLFNMGLKNFDDDDIGKQINNLKIVKYKFNINEIMIFRTFLDNKIILYKIMEDELYILNSTKKIINVVSYIDNYLIIIYEKHEIEIINHKNFKFLIMYSNTSNPEDYISLLLKIIDENLLNDQKVIKENIKPILLPHSKVDNNVNNIKINVKVDGKSLINCERIWHIFALQDNICYCFSVIENNVRLFKYLVNINNQNILFDNILNLINFLKKEFYEPIKLCSYLV